MTASYDHMDLLAGLGDARSLQAKIQVVFEALQARFSDVDRVGVAAFDRDKGTLRCISEAGRPLAQPMPSDLRLLDCPSLVRILEDGRPRVIDELRAPNQSPLALNLVASGFRSSYTIPMFREAAFWGFVFFDSAARGVFDGRALHQLDLYGHLMTEIATAEMQSQRIAQLAVRAGIRAGE